MKNEIQLRDTELEISRVFEAPIELVFEAWSDPDRIQAWSGCEGAVSLGARVDFKVGGRFEHDIRLPNDMELTMQGTYTAIEPGRLIAYTLEWRDTPIPPTTVSVKFESVDGGTRVTLIHSGLTQPEMREEVPKGWSAALDRLASSFTTI